MDDPALEGDDETEAGVWKRRRVERCRRSLETVAGHQTQDSGRSRRMLAKMRKKKAGTGRGKGVRRQRRCSLFDGTLV